MLKKAIKRRNVPRVERCIEQGRLAYYMATGGSEFWARHWPANVSADFYRKAEKGALGFLKKPVRQYLPRTGKIIEAGCGPGQFVLALRKRGYEVEGVELEAPAVDICSRLYPELPVATGDVTQLDVCEGYYSGYISLGVVEHAPEGPEDYLREAYRVLSPNGIAMISVPYFHFLRRVKARLGLYRGTTSGLDFYQYAFTNKEFTEILEEAGFRILKRHPYDGFKGLKDEIPLIRWIVGFPFLGKLFEKASRRLLMVGLPFSHMLLFVCKKEEEFATNY